MRAYLSILILLLAGYVSAQDYPESISGNVEYISGLVYTGEGHLPMPGVQVTQLPDGDNLITGEDGMFRIIWPGEEVWIRFNYPDYSAREVLVKKPGELKIILFPSGTRSSSQLQPGLFGDIPLYKNGSFSMVNGEELNFSGEVNLETALQGRLTGMNVRKISGMPGEGGVFSIRGVSSLFATKQPLIILDGVPINTNVFDSKVVQGAFNNPLSAIDINDIEKVEVYADGASLYGMQGNQGLVVVNTKQPKTVNTKVDFSFYSGMSYEPEYQKLLNGTEHKAYLLNLMQNSGLPQSEIAQNNPWISGNPSYYYFFNYDNNTNWQDEVLDPALVTKYNVTLQGGDEIARFSVSLGYLDQNGIIKNTDFQRYNFRLNSSLQILQRLSMVANIGFSYYDASLMNTGVDYSLNPISAALLKPPMLAPYLRDNQGNRISILSDVDGYGFSNPAAIVSNSESGSFGSNLFAGSKLIYQLNNDMHLSTLVNITFNNIKENVFIPDYGIADFNFGETKNYAEEGFTKISGFTSETRLEYTKEFDLTHFFNANGGFRAITSGMDFNEGNVYNTPTDEFKSLSSVTSIENTLISGTTKKENRSELFVQGDYRYKDKLMAGLILNLSGSSNVGPEAEAINLLGGKWGLFPSLHLAYLVSSEEFLRNVDAIDMIKLRASISYAGNDFYSGYSRYAYVSQPYGTNSGIVRNYIPNPNLEWEKIRQINMGLDAAFFGEKIQLSTDIYQRNTSDLLSYIQVPAIAGFDYFWENNGSLQTLGIDLNLVTKLIYRKKLKLVAGVNFGLNKTKLSLLQDLVIDIPGGQVIMAEGEAPFAFYGLKTNGVFATTAEAEAANLVNSSGVPYKAGDIRFEEQLVDHVIDANDRINLGNIFPNLTGGAFTNITLHNLSLHVLFDFVSGNKLFNYTRMLSESFSGYVNQSVASLHTWKNEGYETEIPGIAYGDPVGNSVFSDRWIEDGSFFRMKEITLAYRLPDTRYYKDVTFYVTGTNLLTFTKYLGYYPEFAYSQNPVLQGSDYSQMPVTKSAVLGVEIGF